MIHRERHQQSRSHKLFLQVTSSSVSDDKRLQMSGGGQCHVHLSRLERVETADLQFAHAVAEVHSEFRDELCFLRGPLHVPRLHLLRRRHGGACM